MFRPWQETSGVHRHSHHRLRRAASCAARRKSDLRSLPYRPPISSTVLSSWEGFAARPCHRLSCFAVAMRVWFCAAWGHFGCEGGCPHFAQHFAQKWHPPPTCVCAGRNAMYAAHNASRRRFEPAATGPCDRSRCEGSAVELGKVSMTADPFL
jgi:hypothetical protein